MYDCRGVRFNPLAVGEIVLGLVLIGNMIVML